MSPSNEQTPPPSADGAQAPPDSGGYKLDLKAFIITMVGLSILFLAISEILL